MRRMIAAVAAAGLVFGAACAAALETPAPLPGAAAAKDLFETKCSACHSLERPLGKNKDRDGWTETVQRMREKRAGWISDEEGRAIVDYLVRERGPRK